ncbi:MAG TPA: type II toxin-antitoxin system RelE/ParE family toxin [Syntrophales bacterium]|nr:type II toxin-antitoxin system RelE/ParE family toxin [Syntrophales bacterium]HPX81254.1 type II toxin-antitoxin system RelE/ParE family toxin [Syntrophales bacterium]
MQRKKTITFTISAINDLDDMRAWYAEQQVPAGGDKLLREIVSQVERLGAFPESGRVVPEFGLANLREIIFPPFRIIYRLDESKVRVVRVWRSERHLKIP